MSKSDTGFKFSVPYEIAVARPLRQTTHAERQEFLRRAHFNTELIPQESIYIDLSTDSGVSALSTDQWAALNHTRALEPGMGLASEGSGAYKLLTETLKDVFGFPCWVPTPQGRVAEKIWAKLQVRPESVVAGNMLFPSTRLHIEMNGGKVIDVIGEVAHDLGSHAPFKGDLDLAKLEDVFRQYGDEKVAAIYVELSVNACGGQPVSLSNLKAVKKIAADHHIPVFLDACRILENSYFIKDREDGFQDWPLKEIVKAICEQADACTMSALKDFFVPVGGAIGIRDKALQQKATMMGFLDGTQPPDSAMTMFAYAMREIIAAEANVTSRVEQVNYLWRRLSSGLPLVNPPAGHAIFLNMKRFLPHLSADQHPAEALAAFVYEIAGIRLTKGPPAAPSQTARGIELLRMAVPARKYLQGHMDDIAEALLYTYAKRSEIKGLRLVEDATRTKYEPAYYSY